MRTGSIMTEPLDATTHKSESLSKERVTVGGQKLVISRSVYCVKALMLVRVLHVSEVCMLMRFGQAGPRFVPGILSPSYSISRVQQLRCLLS
jgi:hypothetical protein